MSTAIDAPKESAKRRVFGPFRVTGVIFLGLGAFMLAQSMALGLGQLVRPGPGLWPAALSGLLMVFALVLVVVDRPEDYEPWGRKSVHVLLGVASLLAFVLVFEAVGFLIAAFLMLLLWLRVFGAETWPWTVGLALVGAIGFHLLFVNALGVPFPEGILPL